jgi:glycosyltransferase involved in cell wall biosynthesis
VKVIVIASSGELGGAELSLVTFLDHRPASVDCSAVVLGEGPLVDRLAERGVPAHPFPSLAARPTPRSGFAYARWLQQRLRASRPDVAWAVGQKAAALSVLSCRATRIPLVWQKVDLTRDRTLAKPLAALANGVIPVSQAASRGIGTLARRRLLGVVHPPLRVPAASPSASRDAPPTIGTAGRLVPYKGHHRIVEAAALLSEEWPDLRVVLAGGADRNHPHYPEELRALADQLGIGTRLELPGFREDIGSLLAGFTVFVLATFRDEQGVGFEGMPAAMLEASATGVPVVAAAGGGVAEGLRDGETGTLVSSPDPSALAAAIARYLRDPDLARRTGAAGQRFVEDRFSAARSSERLFELLAKAAGGTAA